jgi:hypothetical protein
MMRNGIHGKVDDFKYLFMMLIVCSLAAGIFYLLSLYSIIIGLGVWAMQQVCEPEGFNVNALAYSHYRPPIAYPSPSLITTW